MNKEISIVFMPEFLMAAMAPVKNRFTLMKDSSNEDKFWLYFSAGEDSRIDNGYVYKDAFLENKPGYFGNIYELMLSGKKFGKYNLGMQYLFGPIQERLKCLFNDSLSQLSNSVEENDDPMTVIAVVHSSIKKEVVKVIKNCFAEKKLILTFSPFSFPHLLLKNMKNIGEINGTGSNFVIIDGLTDDLSFTAVTLNSAGVFETVGEQVFYDAGMDPRINIIANIIVEGFDKKYGLSLSREKKSFYLKKNSNLSREVLDKVLASSLGRYNLQTELTFEGIPDNYSQPFEKKFIEDTVQHHIYKIRSDLESFLSKYKFTHQSIGKILILGDNLNIKDFQTTLGYESQKVRTLKSDEVYLALLKELLSGGTADISLSPSPGKTPEKEVQNIESAALSTGAQVEIGWIAGNGSFRQLKLIYGSNNLYTVRESINCDLKTGMTFTCGRLELNSVNILNVSGKYAFKTGALTVLKLNT
jgi:hypothetical protein